MADKFGYDVKGLEEAIAGIMTLTQGIPYIATFAITNIGQTIVERAKDYLYGDAEPYGEDWPDLWEDPENPPPGLGTWTPEWNKESRVTRRDDGHPLLDTGGLAESIQITAKGRKSGTAAWISVGVAPEYEEIAAKHEYGGNNPLPGHNDIPARPFLFPAIVEVFENKKYLRELEDVIDKMVRDALLKKKDPRTNKTAKRGKRR